MVVKHGKNNVYIYIFGNGNGDWDYTWWIIHGFICLGMGTIAPMVV